MDLFSKILFFLILKMHILIFSDFFRSKKFIFWFFWEDRHS